MGIKCADFFENTDINFAFYESLYIFAAVTGVVSYDSNKLIFYLERAATRIKLNKRLNTFLLCNQIKKVDYYPR